MSSLLIVKAEFLYSIGKLMAVGFLALGFLVFIHA